MTYQQTLEELETAITELIADNQDIPVIVEGDRDVQALRRLNLTGPIIQFNQGLSTADFCDMISTRHETVILLTDWDHRGGRLHHTLKRNLEYRVHCITKYRDTFATRSSVRTVESLPAWLTTLKTKALAQLYK
jgi:5S rRNA maturation endonuclease (ribonuclease M5)